MHSYNQGTHPGKSNQKCHDMTHELCVDTCKASVNIVPNHSTIVSVNIKQLYDHAVHRTKKYGSSIKEVSSIERWRYFPGG